MSPGSAADVRRHLAAAIMLAALALSARAEEPWAGTVKSAIGTVLVERGGKQQPLAVGDRVLPQDRLVTGKDGRLGVTLRDDTLISAGPNSRLSLDDFRFDPTTHNGSVLVAVARGVTAFVSGLVAKSDPQAMQVKTPTATAGIRGTEFVVEVETNE